MGCDWWGSYPAGNGKIPALRTDVLGIWTNEKWKKEQIFEKVKEKKKELQGVRKLSTNVRGKRLNKLKYPEKIHGKFMSCRYRQNVCAWAEEKQLLLTLLKQAIWENNVCAFGRNAAEKGFLRKFPIDFTGATWYHADKSLGTKRFMQEPEKRNSDSRKT